MKKRNKLLTLLLCAALLIGLVPFTAQEAQAEVGEPSITQFADVGKLKGFDTDDTDGNPNPAKVYFGNNSQQWWIAGEERGNIVLFAASPLARGIQFNDSTTQKNYDANWGCIYSVGSTINPVNPNHYGGSDIRNGNKTVNPANPGLAGLLKSCFTEAERGLMNATTVYTQDTANSNVAYSTEDKLYLANGSLWGIHVSVGANNNLRIDKTYWGSDYFWLRAPYDISANHALVAGPSNSVYYHPVHYYSDFSVVPAFNLNLSNVLFASAAPAATGDGGKLETKDVTGDGAFTLRHSSTSVGDAETGNGNVCVSISNVSTNPAVNTYLVAQNSEGAWAKKVNNGDIIFADEVSSSLTSFDKCKVWLETTDTTDTTNGLTYAKEATSTSTQSSYNVKVKCGDHMSITNGSGKQVGVNGQISDITVTADSGYYFPKDYSVTPVNGISVKRENNTTLTISGKPTADTLLTLPVATAKTKAPQPALSEGNIKRTKNSLTVTGNFDTATYGAIEYRYKQAGASDWAVDWTEGTEISGLQAGTEYTLAIRYKGNDNYSPSDAAELTVSTLKEGANTGDESSPALWIALMLIALAGAGGTAIYSKKKKAR